MIKLKDKDTGLALDSITEEHLKFLVDQLEEESDEDQDYYLNQTTVDLFAAVDGADPALIDVLRKALNGREEMEIVWSRT
ncbi:MAG: galactosyldiacylglycerol synthase [Burkholderiales bacterium RIFCSPLOWO2_02_FULL_57_36]|nr:MAG: galactosyldiacylglycerol synthase [Burkholderiales bacterium RIFCSPLOWO2_02_FULL_57_36]